MEKQKIIVVGGVALGASFATRMRRINRNTDIVMYEKSNFISYANCGLPYNLSGKIERERLELVTPEEMKEKFGIKTLVQHEVVSIDTKAKTVEVKDLGTGKTFTDTYDKLVLGPGTSALTLPIPGLKEEVDKFPLKNLDHLDKLQAWRKETGAKNFIVMGAGFIGLEVAESLVEDGANVSVVEIANTVVKLDKDMSSIAEKELETKGVHLFLNAKLVKFDSKKKEAHLEDGRIIPYDAVITSAGVVPNTKFIKEAGIAVDDRGIVVTNEYMQTSDESVYAGGDIVYSPHKITGKKVYSPLAWGANRQAKVIANHLAGIEDKQPATLNTAIIKLFRLPVAQTGLNEFAAKQEGYDFDFAYYSGNHHASYYPAASKVVLKVVYDKKTMKVLGAQAIGPSADKKIDVIATAIYHDASMHDLLDYNLSYSPPYGSAKDVVNVAAAIAINKQQQNLKTINAEDVKEDMLTIDVRPLTVFEVGTIPGAINIPLEELITTSKLPKDKNAEINVLCSTGHTSYNGMKILQGLGYTNIRNCVGGHGRYHIIHSAKEYQPTIVPKGSVKLSNEAVSKITASAKENAVKINVDCTGLACPGPILKLHKTIQEAKDGTVLNVTASDFGFEEDIKTWTAKNGHTLISVSSDDSTVNAVIMKGKDVSSLVTDDSKAMAQVMTQGKDKATIVLFSGEYDKVLAAMIIAQAAASIGKEVIIFATFWGLNALRIKPGKKPKKKFMKKMFGLMMPKGVEKMPLSNMNMGGMGKAIIKSTMKKHNVKKPSEMIQDSLDLGVTILACTMSMELLGITKEELVTGTRFAGAAKYVSDSDDSNLTLFI